MANILTISGSPSPSSRTSAVLEAVRRRLKQRGAQTAAVSVLDVPPEDLMFGRYDSPSIAKVAGLIEAVDGVVIGTPIYKAAYTGVLKSLLDLLPREVLAEKAVLPIASGGTLAHALALDYALNPVLQALGARRILKGVFVLDSGVQRAGDGQWTLDSDVEQRVWQAAEQLWQAVHGRHQVHAD
ncbi:MAG: NADPH-dependent FMN reductase [Kyrpidia sp.]|nr:NADPH-dependent FMN reductase [Kyrpidia sp.]